MDHTCYRCHAEIPESTAFCPHCGAPQIRVVTPETEAQQPPPTAEHPEAPGQVLPPPPPAGPPPYPYWGQGTTSPPQQPGIIRWDLAWKGALLSGIGAAVLSAIPFVSLGCCLWMLCAGAFSVALYRKQVPGTLITPGMGMRLGALAGVFGFVANAIVSTLSLVSQRTNFRQAMEEQMHKQMAGNTDPKVQQMVQNMLDWMSTPQGEATLIVMFLVIFGIVFVVLTAAGGAIGASMFGPRRELR